MVRRYVLQRDSCRLGRNVIKQYIDINGCWKVIVLYNVYLSQLDAGFTHTDFNNKLSIVGIGEASSAS